jgi:hypothetical protein
VDSERLYGTTPHELNQACLLAVTFGDHALSLELFKKIGGELDTYVWRNQQEFDMYRKWASGAP